MRRQGTTTVEIKSGYGLTVEDEVRALRVAREFTTETTFLGAHVVPAEYARRPGRLSRPGHRADAGGRHPVRPLDRRVLRAELPARVRPATRPARCSPPAAAGLGLRVHGNQLGPGPGVQLAVELGAASVDHCTHLAAADIDALVDAADTTVATLLPGVEFSTRSPYPDARRCSPPGCRSRWPPTATRAPATRPRCRS